MEVKINAGRSVPLWVISTSLLAAAGQAHAAATVIGTLTLQNSTQLVTTGATTVFSSAYILPSDGILEVRLTDNNVFAPLAQLDFSLVKGVGGSSSLVRGPNSAAGISGAAGTSRVWDFEVTGGTYTTLFQVAAQPLAGFSGFWLGQYTDTITFTPSQGSSTVPLPATGASLGAGVSALVWLARRRRARPGLAA
jgi:hypothetical protein